MKISTHRLNKDVFIIKAIGRFNIEEVLNFEKKVNKYMFKKIKTIALDLSELKYIDSSGIGSLIKTMNISYSHNIDLVIIDISSDILNIFKLAFLDKFFTITSLKELMKSIEK